jgi:mycofactocin system creatininase family protein
MVTKALGDWTWPELAERSIVLVVPIGSLEQHGPHLPLDTDTRIAVAIAEQAADRRDDLLVAPALAIGASGEHAGFPGTLSIGSDALRTVVVELVRSADAFRGVILVNGHGGNHDAMHAATTQLRAERRNVVTWSPSVPGGDAHAGHTETSIMLAIDPGCVRVDRIQTGTTEPLREILDAMRAGGVRSVSPTGVLGDPSTANATDGARILTALVDHLGTTIDEVFPT